MMRGARPDVMASSSQTASRMNALASGPRRTFATLIVPGMLASTMRLCPARHGLRRWRAHVVADHDPVGDLDDAGVAVMLRARPSGRSSATFITNTAFGLFRCKCLERGVRVLPSSPEAYQRAGYGSFETPANGSPSRGLSVGPCSGAGQAELWRSRVGGVGGDCSGAVAAAGIFGSGCSGTR